jgi:hypothetical protein
VGYAGALTAERFEIREGLWVGELRVTGYDGMEGEEGREMPKLRIVVLNDMNLDTPAGSKTFQGDTYHFLNDVINASPDFTRPALFTLLLTHTPLHRPAGVCVDAPYFAFHDGEFAFGVKEQNHLSDAASQGLLEGVFGMSGDENVVGRGIGRHSMNVMGHDHEGCDVYHFIDQTIARTRCYRCREGN